MAQIMQSVLQAPQLAAEMSQRGKHRAKLFDWDISARQLYTASQRLDSSINAGAKFGTAKPQKIDQVDAAMGQLKVKQQHESGAKNTT
jgi:hypothetical protein